MDHLILKKRLNTFKTGSGKLTGVSDALILEILKVWEEWPGKSKALYQSLGLNSRQLVHLIKKGKALVKSGAAIEKDFKEIKVADSLTPNSGNVYPIAMKWDKDRVIRFKEVDQLVDFLKKVAA